MKTKKMSEEAMNSLQKMLLDGKTPEDASRHFKVAVSSIHNYKRELKARGIELPNVRGQRPKDPDPNLYKPIDAERKEDFLYITVGETSIRIKNTAKTITINENEIKITF